MDTVKLRKYAINIFLLDVFEIHDLIVKRL